MTLRSIKKSAAVLLTMILLNRPTGEKEISEILDINIETVRRHLNSLQKVGLAGRIAYQNGWVITGIGGQLMLESADFPRFIPTTTVKEESLNTEDMAVVDKERESQSADFPRFAAPVDNLWTTLKMYGIERNRRTEQLVGKPWMTIDYIHEEARKLKQRGNNGHTPGLLITILETGPISLNPLKGHMDGCVCDLCERERLRYLEWEDGKDE